MNIWVITIIIMVASMLIQQTLTSKFNKYSKVPTSNGMSGAEVAQKMLYDNGIYDVKVVPTRGMLTDHYNPVTKTVNLVKAYMPAEALQRQQWQHTNADTQFSTQPATHHYK